MFKKATIRSLALITVSTIYSADLDVIKSTAEKADALRVISDKPISVKIPFSGKLPSSDVLKERLSKSGFFDKGHPNDILLTSISDLFFDLTNLHTELGDKEWPLTTLQLTVEQSLYTYDKYLSHPVRRKIMQVKKTQMLKAILQDQPEAIDYINKHPISIY